MAEVDHNLDEGKNALRKANHLRYEKSPYLQQHTYNPVDWYPWGKEAFDKAKRDDKPIFLSIGYSTCHWCHVMAKESFEDPEVASLMNRMFVCIKVDREERPDIDMQYMTAAIGMIGQGGWPLTIIMTPEKKPFFAATYLPKNGRFGRTGMMDLIPRIGDLWTNHRSEIQDASDNVVDLLSAPQKSDASFENPDESTLKKGFEDLLAIFDSHNGGFGTAPKFPTPHILLFLLRYWKRSSDPNSLQMVESTLQSIRMGGIYDHLGFGVHRYSTDAEWHIPHFEKMLYDQALMSIAYTEAYQETGKKEYKKIAKEIIEYVLRDLTSSEGGFYSAEDADSENEEGKFYIWDSKELAALLENDEFKLLIRLFNVHEIGSFQGKNILRLRASIKDAADILKVSEEELQENWDRIRAKLFLARSGRVRPIRDEKILTDWNGLMIVALAKASQAFGDAKYEMAAKKAADFLLEKMRDHDRRLLHRYLNGSGVRGNLNDYAFLVWGLIELYETNFIAQYLLDALELNKMMIEHFWDYEEGGFFFTPSDGETILIRQKDFHDGAIPSGNSVAMANLASLSHFTGNHELDEKASMLGRKLSSACKYPARCAMFLCSLDFALGPSIELALVGRPDDDSIRRMLCAARTRFVPNKIVLIIPDEKISQIAGFTKNMVQKEEKATAYLCLKNSCNFPINDISELIKMLKKLDEKGNKFLKLNPAQPDNA